MAPTPVCHIVCAGPGELPSFAFKEGDLLIAADGGYAACLEAGLQPQLLVGDFDSLEGGVPQDPGCQLIVLPRAKDDTDFMVCVREALSRGYRDIRGYKTLGGDFGHAVGAIKILSWLRRQGAVGALYGCGQTVVVVLPEDGDLHLSDWVLEELCFGTRVSVFSYGGDAAGVCEQGLVWELDDAAIDANDHFGVSNEVAEGDPVVSVERGALLVVIG